MVTNKIYYTVVRYGKEHLTSTEELDVEVISKSVF
jgi:hypothetical protein